LASRKVFCVFQKLHGYNPLQNVVIVNNIRGQVHTEVGNKREARSKDIFELTLENGARRGLHKGTAFVAETIPPTAAYPKGTRR
jgi:hypothetical protein